MSENQYDTCVIGAGPAGLAVARALAERDLPYTHIERHTGPGGLWDIDNPGSPMYETAHFISSRFTSGFYGFPMPDHLPDYPNHRQILAYVRSFADAYGLRGAVECGVGVQRAEPVGPDARDGWRVTLSTGEVRQYRGLVCANGVTWHPLLPDYPGLDSFAGEVRGATMISRASHLFSCWYCPKVESKNAFISKCDLIS